MSLRAAFLIIVAAIIFQRSFLETFTVLVGYSMFSTLDQWLEKRARRKVFEEEISEWKADPDDSVYESRGNLSRVKLVDQHRIVVVRVAELLERMLILRH
jgi:hypothetical protein